MSVFFKKLKDALIVSEEGYDQGNSTDTAKKAAGFLKSGQSDVGPVTQFPNLSPVTGFAEDASTISSGLQGIPAAIMEEVIKKYSDGFAAMNKPGIDFYEYLELITKAHKGSLEDQPLAYEMAFGLLGVEKPSLISGAEQYIAELTAAHESQVKEGQVKSTALDEEQQREESTLRGEISNLEKQIQQLNAMLQAKKAAATSIGTKFSEQKASVQQKIAAHVVAFDRIVAEINRVKNGLNQFIKV